MKLALTYSFNKHVLSRPPLLGSVSDMGDAVMWKHTSRSNPHRAYSLYWPSRILFFYFLALWPWVSHTILWAFLHSKSTCWACAMCHSQCWGCWWGEVVLCLLATEAERQRVCMTKQQVWLRLPQEFSEVCRERGATRPLQWGQGRLHRGVKEETRETGHTNIQDWHELGRPLGGTVKN